MKADGVRGTEERRGQGAMSRGKERKRRPDGERGGSDGAMRGEESGCGNQKARGQQLEGW